MTLKIKQRIVFRQRDYRNSQQGADKEILSSQSPRRKGLLPLQARAVWRRVGNRLLQRLAEDEGFLAPGKIERAIDAHKGQGKPLEPTVRTKMEKAFETDFSHVRVHDHPAAAALNETLASRAFTTGYDIFFGAGEYAPNSVAGQRLLAHELAHVVQQQDGAAYWVGPANDPAEREAETMARAAIQALSRQVEEEEEEEEVQALRRQPEEEEEEVLA